jgi:hypothetical protein
LSPPTRERPHRRGEPSPEGLFHHPPSSSRHGEPRRPARAPACSPSSVSACANRLSAPHRPGHRLRPRHCVEAESKRGDRAPRRFARPASPACAARLGLLLQPVAHYGPIAPMGQAEPRPWAKIGPTSFLFLSNFVNCFKFPEI